MRAVTGIGRGLTALALGAVLVLAGCAGSRPPVPLRPEPVAYADTLPIEEPRERSAAEMGRLFEVATGGEFVRPFDLRRLTGNRHPALNVTRHDDVVGSSWWERRMGYRSLSPAEVADGPPGMLPDTMPAVTVTGAKTAGISAGFTVRGPRGREFVLKLDPKGYPNLASGADVVTARILWAAGYHVPDDEVMYLDSARLTVGPGATIETAEGERPMRPEDVARVLAKTDVGPGGYFRALCSPLLPGEPKGPFYFSDTREDDPNDYYPHQHRRELRALRVFAAWLNHIDMRFANTLDVYVEPGYLRHYLIDFGGSLGSGTVRPRTPRGGLEYNFDLWQSLGRLATLGFYRSGWEGYRPGAIHPSIGWIRTEGFRPGEWKANWPNPAFRALTPRDGYWAAKIVASFSDEHLEAVVREAHLPAPAADTLVDILAYRRDATVDYWFGRVTPLEDVSARATDDGGIRLTFRDLGIGEGTAEAGGTRYRWRFLHPALDRSASGTTEAGREARQEMVIRYGAGAGADPEPHVSELSQREQLARLRIRALRGEEERPRATVFLEWLGRGEGYRVVGLRH